jgi:hypothetical protein
MQTAHLEHGKSEAANFDPANYRYVVSGYNGSNEEAAEIAALIFDDYSADQQHAIRTAIAQEPYSGLNCWGWGGKCLHCGKHLKWFVLFQDIRTGHYVTTGTTCAEELHLEDKGHLIRKKMGERIERARKLAKVDLRFPGLRQELDRVVIERNRAYFQKFLVDLNYKVNHYLDLSDRQAEVAKRFLKEGLDRIEERARELAERKSAPAPSGRVVVTGKVLTVKEYEVEDPFSGRWGSGYKTIYKMLVEDDRGFRCFGSLPSGISLEKKSGARITFRATLEPKKDDITFAFFKRPSNAAVLEQEATPAAVAA